MTRKETVKIAVRWEASSQGASEDDVLDTELTPEGWEALGEDGQTKLGGELPADWRDNLVQSGWCEITEEG